MTNEQARQLQLALTGQHYERMRLMAAANDDTIKRAAEAYIDATDRAFAIVTEIKEGEAA